MEAAGSFEMAVNTEENKSCRNFKTTISKIFPFIICHKIAKLCSPFQTRGSIYRQ
jgi:hypothetical protein